ncbi:SMI1/KNR4 family protein [Dactylosporangium sp. NPDC051485]|uniref:SMI1/KNR4 family protein n=1 Tax=Dactylosporangium sp. NPDC051485 TaxID=3154846 RepID=UPI0034189294
MIGMAPFEQVIARFWHADEKHGMLPPLTQDMIAAAEGELGVTLPADLLRLLRVQNGGLVAEAWDASPAEANFYAEDHVPFDHLAGIGPSHNAGAVTLLDTPYLVQEWDLPSPIVLLSGQGHYWVALDYRACGPRGNPSVVWLDDEMEQELRLAHDFRAFVEQLASSASYLN